MTHCWSARWPSVTIVGELIALAPYADGLVDEPLAAAMYLDGRLALVDSLLHYFDHMSMAHSLEVRVPFLITTSWSSARRSRRI